MNAVVVGILNVGNDLASVKGYVVAIMDPIGPSRGLILHGDSNVCFYIPRKEGKK